MIALLMAAGMMAAPVNCRPKELFRRQAGQTCISPGPHIAPAHMDAIRHQLKSLIASQGQLDPAAAAAVKAEAAKTMAAKGIRRRYGPVADTAPFRKFEARPAPTISHYAY
ncbi:MAG: hypothetical protein ACYDD1_10215 [Caulobacteraceae bacterium]